ncbi:MAG: hypothetical protein E6J90_50500 [Deltaproteobacteria bacterium]|nr:MAG: hypothetical protein E6J90_50500 [Deltaproteobacteria bacterium]
MANSVAAAYPFIEVLIDTSALRPAGQRSPGVIAVVGVSTAGDAAANAPMVCDTLADAATHFGASSALTKSLALAFLQDPAPSKVYGVKIGGTGADADIVTALDALNAADDVDFVSLAGIVDPKLLLRLKEHVEQASAAGHKRLGVAMIDPAKAKTPTYATDAINTVHPSGGGVDLLSSVSRMVMIAARGATLADGATAADIATAGMAAIAGQAPATSMVLKRVRGISIPLQAQYTSAEIKALSEANIIPIIQPSMIVGGGFYFGEGRCFTSDASMLYIDIVRVLDDIDFRLKAGLIGLVGDARITRGGLTTVRSAVQGILGPLQRAAVIDGFDVQIPLLDTLAIPESARTATDTNLITTARANRSVDMLVSITYGPAVHRLHVTLQPKF